MIQVEVCGRHQLACERDAGESRFGGNTVANGVFGATYILDLYAIPSISFAVVSFNDISVIGLVWIW